MKPTEAEMTAATEAAAKAHYESLKEDSAPAWEGLPTMVQYHIRDSIVKVAVAAIECLEDRRYAAFNEGYAKAAQDAAAGRLGVRDPENPYAEES